MAHDGRVAKRYAHALFNTAVTENMVASVDADLSVLTNTINGSAELRDFLVRPETTTEDKLSLIDKVFGDRITSLTHSAVKLLVAKGRDNEISGIQKEFAELRRRSETITKATITSAEALDAAQQKAVIAKLEKELGRTVESDFEVDASLIGGIKIVYDNYILDGSVRGQLDRMKDKILYDVLKQA